MTKEDKDLLLRDLCARLPYQVEVWCDMDKTFDGGIIGALETIHLEGNYISLKGAMTPFRFDEIKPCLRPMESMTEEEIQERNNNALFHSGNIVAVPTYIDWLNAHHFDYRNLIGRGLAIDCTGLHIYD